MICKNCQTENEDDAAFCKNCGKRLDGIVECPECKTENSEDSRFCKKCGKPLISDKNVCANCGEEFTGNFCPKCGTSVSGTAPAGETDTDQEEATQSEENYYAALADATAYTTADIAAEQVVDPTKHGWRKWVLLAGSIAGLVGVVLSLLFTYLINIVPAFGGPQAESLKELGDYSINLSWLVGDGLDLAQAKMDAFNATVSFDSSSYPTGFEAAYTVDAYMPIIFTLIILSATIITVFVNLIIAIIRYVYVFQGKPAKSIEKPTFAAILSYIFGACLIKAIWAAKLSVSGIYSISYGFGGATIAGIVLTCLCLCAFIGSRIAVNGKELIKVKNIVRLAACALGVVFVSVVWASATGTVAGCKVSVSGYKQKESYGFMQILKSLNLYEGLGHYDYPGSPDYTAITLLSIFGFIFVTVVSSLAMSAMTKMLTNAMNTEKKSTLANSIVLTVFAVIFLAISIVAVNELFEVTGWKEGGIYKKVNSAGIIVLIFAILTLAVSIAEKIVDKVFTNKGLYE